MEKNTMVATDHALKMISEYNELSEQIKELEAKKSAVADNIKKYMNRFNLDHITKDGRNLATFTITESKTFDRQAATEALGEDVINKFVVVKEGSRLNVSAVRV